ncbi:barren [Lentinus tigrinus ALCF2SS1-7]|uniref:barren n=1 Tax=Lentinus tigrinus ALCF2SS1-7 TaxID=1328758 RepID=UPI00116612A0|nr:barren [Lentinus tigrinus ALCF2SS1-7]
MPTTRIRPQQENSRSSYPESDSGGDTERETTPRPTTNRSRKRLSERIDPDGSFSLDSSTPTGSNPRAPLKNVNINDDVAEKRRRRKSAKIAVPLDEDGPEAGPSSAGHPAEGAEGAAEGSKTAPLGRQKSQLLSIPQAPIINVPMDIMASNYDQWMKMATDNKINATNSWNFALIDYFHDMSLLRNNDDNSINFQRASCTLDGCVKIWTSRVDSVGTETGKLLSNLANEGRDEDDGNGSDNPEGGEPSQSQRKRKGYRSESTLAKNPTQLRTKKLELEFSVDPLFRKTCADFDEGGAQGLLMNHLGLTVTPDGSLRVVFDASDSVAKDDEEEQPLEEPRDDVDLSYLREHFLPSLDAIDEQEISQSLDDFAFGKDSFFVDDSALFRGSQHAHGDDDDDDDENDGFGGVQDFGETMDVDGISPSAVGEDFFIGDQAVPDDFNADFGADFGGDGDNASVNGSDSALGESRPGGPFVPFDPRRVPNDREMVMAINEDGEGMMNYFDPSYLKNWAGPEHWKLRKVIRRPDATEAASRPKREKKEAFKIDFLTPVEDDLKSRKNRLFTAPTRGDNTLPAPGKPKRGARGKKSKSKDKEEKRYNQTLPDDMHFSSKQLVTLFLKPKFSLRMRGQRGRTDGGPEGDIDEAFWAQAAANQAGSGGQGADEIDGGGIPFATQFFHDDYDDGPGFDDVYDGGDGGAPVEAGEQDLLAATQGHTRRVKPEAVNYAKRAKRVDVRKLKENIWKGLDIVAAAVEDGEDAMDTDERPPTDPEEARSFTSVISGLHQSYPKDKMDEISTSFCFICLLHLANERGLKLEVDGKTEDEDDVMEAEVEDRKVGNLWDLKVYRDPNATPAS